MISNLSITKIQSAFQTALKNGLIRNEDSSVIFYDLDYLEERIRYLVSLFPTSALHGIAVKANPLIFILKILNQIGVGAEAASLGEVMIALNTGYSPEKIVFDSPVKTIEELEFALTTGIHINLDSLAELERVAALKKKYSSASTIGIRINPQVGTGTILESSVAGEYSKFGVPIKTRRNELIEAFTKYDWLTGVHLHVGSQGCPMEMLLQGIGVVYEFVQEVHSKSGHPQINIFDIGGGFPISYDHHTVPASMEEYVSTMKNRFPALFSDHFTLFTEFGRWAHVNSGWTMSRVEYVKHDIGINTAMIHVGADLFLRECLNPESWPHVYSVLDKDGNLKTGKDKNPYNLAGPLCFSGDILAKNVELPVVVEGDYLIIHDTGGYTFSMWSHYNSRQTPRILGYFKDCARFEILKERGTDQDLVDFWK